MELAGRRRYATEGTTVESAALAEPTGGIQVEDKGLKKNAITFVSNVVIGVASTAPGYSMAATLGIIAAVAGLGLQSPAVILIAFFPMAAIAAAYYYMNRADPDCGTTFTWMTRAMGPWLGWQGGWAIVVADVLVMPSLASVAGNYTFQLFGNTQPTNLGVTLVGGAWIVIMTAICYVGIELSARTQQLLLGMEFTTLVIFAVVALVKVYTSHPAHSIAPEASWFNPFAISSISALNGGILLAVFIYWGWDSGVTVNEETEDSSTAPGRAAIISTFILVGIYLLVATAAQAFGGLHSLQNNSADVFAPLGKGVLGSPLDKLLIIAVLTSASASTQTTILPTARTTLSMARMKAVPRQFGNVHPRFLSPGFSTIWMGVVSTAVYLLLSITSPQNLIPDAFTSLALTIAFYYGFTGFACVIFYRRELLKSAKNFLFIGVLPLFGGLVLTWVLIKAVIDYSKPHAGFAKPFLGIGSPVAIAILTVFLGVVLMIIQRITMPDYFRRKPEVVDPSVLAHAPAGHAS
jgi:amino acid transporter